MCAPWPRSRVSRVTLMQSLAYGARSTGGSALHRGAWSALHREGVWSENPSDMFDYSIGLEPVGSVHFRTPARPWWAGAVERGAARAADAKMTKKGPKQDFKRAWVCGGRELLTSAHGGKPLIRTPSKEDTRNKRDTFRTRDTFPN